MNLYIVGRIYIYRSMIQLFQIKNEIQQIDYNITVYEYVYPQLDS